MTRRNFLAAASAGPLAAQASAPYNLLYILTDQHSGLAMPANGDTTVRVPNLDRLAAQGVSFTNACSAGMTCGPSRASLDTGLHHPEHGVRAGSPLPEEIPTLRKTLAANGYTLSEPRHTESGTLKGHLDWLKSLGYREVETNYTGSIPSAGFLDLPLRWKIGRAGLAPEHSYDAYIAERALRFLEENRERRFACFVQFRGPHDPYLTPRPWVDMFDPAKLPMPKFRNGEFESKPPRQFASWRKQGADKLTNAQLQKVRAIYYGMVAQDDYHTGRVLSRLAELGLDRNTVVVYLSDHGDTMGHHRIFSKDYAFYEPTVRTPMIFRTPDESFRRNVKNGDPVSGIDLFPTLLDLLRLPSASGLPGRSLVPYWRGERSDPNRALYCGQGFEGHNRAVMLRKGMWKLTRYDDGGGELYDRESDPAELTNLFDSARHSGMREKLTAELRDWDRSMKHRPPIFSGRETEAEKASIRAGFEKWMRAEA
jgi:choline-sulfatase